MSSTSITDSNNNKEDDTPLVRNMTATKLRRRVGLENHNTFWRWLNAMTDEEWTDNNGKNCRPTKLGKNYSFFTPNQIVCVYKKFGIKPPRIN